LSSVLQNALPASLEDLVNGVFWKCSLFLLFVAIVTVIRVTVIAGEITRHGVLYAHCMSVAKSRDERFSKAFDLKIRNCSKL